MKIERPEDQVPWWANKRFYCQCGSLIVLEGTDTAAVRVARVNRWIFETTFWYFHCPVCNDWVRFDDRIYYG